ncbi:hypothetical protein [Flavobacterium cellulosilyticum]|uniref:Uncharacterized protein n=1 Tax=Flavobacterium cellulosilyticum TaxID=2541731 RepID=A0A4R5CHK7_9FLAO|nr:hypothetical protein [Flavobacterium cellulosilyticum]TDD98569.1 hypothetical protein E0F76_05420 [Flavobacterium cellulosilyticum]
MGQSSYAQEGWEDEEEWYTNESWDSNDNDYTDNWQDFLSEWFGLDIAGITDGGNFLLSNGDYFYPDSGNLDEVLINSYHVSEQYEYVPIGENNGNPGGDESEETVDDPTDNCSISYCMPGYTLENCECVKISCTTTCDTGYKLNDETCECEELPPCFGSLSELETSNAFDTNKIFNSFESFLSDFGIETDLIVYLKESKLFDPSKLSETLQSYIKTSEYLGNTGDALGIGLSVATYLDEPKTENLLRVSFDVGTLALPPGTSLAISFVELFELRDGETIIDLLLIEASKAIEKLIDCNLGTGIHGLLF